MVTRRREDLLNVNVVSELFDLVQEADQFVANLLSEDHGEGFDLGKKVVRQIVNAMLPLKRHTLDGEVLDFIDKAELQLRAIEAFDPDDCEDEDEALLEFWPEVEAFADDLTRLVSTLPGAAPSKRGIPPDLEMAYSKTDYIVSFPNQKVVLKVGQVSPELRDRFAQKNASSFEWMVITACNPRSVQTKALDNKKAMTRLYRRLHDQGHFVKADCFEALGRLGTWEEESIFVGNTSYQEARWLGREFEQFAVLYGSLEEPAELVLCGPKPPGWGQ